MLIMGYTRKRTHKKLSRRSN